jgi:hypothetical protein
MMQQGINQFGDKTLSGTLTCPKCLKSGQVSFEWQKGPDGGHWRISDFDHYTFNHNERSLGGAEIWCPWGQGYFYGPNGGPGPYR